ncbi:MAG: SagB/ThcOx family dehydrogenase [Deltaproteobacteria bacterium]|nr:SagB/ThcOx family dehydrogenase [Deltaproteobacteria bacterium]
MNNRKLEETWKYHNSTKHPGMPPHYLDWDNQPIPFKIYTTLDPIEIPENLPPTNIPALTAISTDITNTMNIECVPNLKTLGRLLYFSAGITKKVKYPGGEIYFRAAACTGALYHIDLYLVTCDINGLDEGVYHFGLHDFALRKLRNGDFTDALVNATAEEPTIKSAPVTVICASTFWRNSWKYQSRAYRHTFWDNGTILANLLAVSSAHKIPAKIVVGFEDSPVNRLLGLDTNGEVAVSLVPLGNTKKSIEGRRQEIEAINYETMPLSKKEVDYPAIRAMHVTSSLASQEEVKEWRSATTESRLSLPNGKIFQLEITDDKEAVPQIPSLSIATPDPIDQISDSIEKTILRRGSTRQFARASITFRELSNILYRTTHGIPADFLSPFGSTLNDIYLIVNDVEGIPKGAYFYRREANAIELLKEGDFRKEAGHLGLGQRIPADASVDVFFLTDLNNVLEKFGNRGYRAAQLEAGIIGGKLYLGAYARGLGASGLTFYDDDVVRFFSPHAEGKSCMFLVALGKSVKKRG